MVYLVKAGLKLDGLGIAFVPEDVVHGGWVLL
jgi:hypothetical protein